MTDERAAAAAEWGGDIADFLFPKPATAAEPIAIRRSPRWKITRWSCAFCRDMPEKTGSPYAFVDPGGCEHTVCDDCAVLDPSEFRARIADRARQAADQATRLWLLADATFTVTVTRSPEHLACHGDPALGECACGDAVEVDA